MFPTKNDISPAKRKKVCDELTQLLSDAIDLGLQVKQAHWNVTGENFIALHELFDKVYGEVAEAADTIAERIRQLGGAAQGSASFTAKNSQLKPYPLTVAEGEHHADALSSVIAAFNAYGRKAIDQTDELGDAITADMLTGIVRGLDKQLWFVEAHLKGQDKAASSQPKLTKAK